MPDKESIPVKRVLITSFIVDLLDVVLSVLVTILSGSVIMLSQALEGVTDLTSSGLLIYGLSKSHKKADSAHPFGFGRELYFWTLISALIMLSVTSTLTFHFGFDRLLNPRILHDTPLAYGVLILTTFTNFYALSLSFKRLMKGKNTSQFSKVFKNSAFIETKTAFILDLMGTLASILGLIALGFYSITGNGQFDGLGAMLIGVMLAILSIFLLIGVKDFLIGRSVSLETIGIIKNATKRIDEVNSIEGLKASHLGEEMLINIEINAENKLTTDELEKVIDKVKSEIRKDLPSATHIQVELESK
jgi:cation diffusion facilitator family transporter